MKIDRDTDKHMDADMDVNKDVDMVESHNPVRSLEGVASWGRGLGLKIAGFSLSLISFICHWPGHVQ